MHVALPRTMLFLISALGSGVFAKSGGPQTSQQGPGLQHSAFIQQSAWRCAHVISRHTKATRVWTAATAICAYHMSVIPPPWEQLHMLSSREVLHLGSVDDSLHTPAGDLDVLQHHLAGVLGRVLPVQHHIQHHPARPHIRLLAIIFLTQEHFWGCMPEGICSLSMVANQERSAGRDLRTARMWLAQKLIRIAKIAIDKTQFLLQTVIWSPKFCNPVL